MTNKRDLVALAAVILAVAAMAVFRATMVEPRHWGAACLELTAAAPLGCWPRAGLLWLQHWQLWGLGALALGVWAFLGAPLAVRAAAVALGVIAVLNFNATWGVLAACLGTWAWVGALARGSAPRPGAAAGR